jgi:diacylglycerol kinase family enzyme
MADRFSLRIADFGALTVFTNLRAIWRGTFRHQKLQDFLVDAISVECEDPTPLQVGGDVVGHRTEISARLRPHAIRVVDFSTTSPDPAVPA